MGRPNLIFILADDLGHADLGCYGGRGVDVSPHLDRMAASGLRFTRAYANSPVCSPTRFALMTGRYQYRLRGAAEEPMTGKFRGSTTVGLPPAHPTLPSLLRAAGYRTALVGKWHLGYPPHFGPLLSGYDQHFGPLSGGVSYFSHVDRGGEVDLHEDGVPVKHHGHYLTDLLSDRAVDFIGERARDRQPFLLSLHYTAPHWPWETRHAAAAPAITGATLAHLHGGSIATYLQMVREMDEGIGRVLQALQQGGLDEDTLVVFTSDNGGERFSDNWPLAGGKMDLTEGGIRVPCIARWPRCIAPGSVSAQQHLTMDWTATFLAAADVPADPAFPLDGVSLLPALQEPTQTFAQRAWRDGRWKYLKVDTHEYLFDIETDERERANRASVDSQRLNALRAAWERFDAALPTIPEDAGVSLVYGPADMPAR
jgi:arylsulfatase A-like enzyme